MDYGRLFSRSWEIVWNNKFMIVLGFLAALGSGGSGGGTNFNFSADDLPPGLAPNLERFWNQFAPLLIGLVCLGIVLVVVFWLIRLTAQAGLISAAARLDAGEQLTFGQAFSTGASYLGRMVGINVLMFGPFTLLGLLTAVIILSVAGTAIMAELAGRSGNVEALLGTLGILAACLGLLACLLVPLLIVVTVIYPFAQRGAVLRNLGVTASIGHGWQVLRNNLGDIALLVLFFIVLSVVFGFIAAIVLIPFAFLALGPAAFGMISRGSIQALDIVWLIGGGICLGLVAAIVNSILVAFRSTVFTLAYQHFTSKAVEKPVI